MKELLVFMAPAGLALVIGVATSANDPNRAANTQLFTQASQTATRLSVETTRNDAAQSLANYRFSQRCLFVDQVIQGYRYTSSEGVAFPDGTYVCSSDGTTGELKNSVAEEIAVTGDLETIKEWLNRVQ
ncbi:MAG TPA: hypothetical protein V6D29_01380 [Leptolyngbyaceae cyanobacterium]